MSIDTCFQLLRDQGHTVKFLTSPESADWSAVEPRGRHLGVYPQSSEEVGSILALVSPLAIPIYPRGAGTGVTGGAVPCTDGVVIFLEGLNQIEEIDTANHVAVVQPGVITGVFQAACELEGLFYPPDPASLDTCSIGGNVIQNAGGPRALKYGVTRDYVLGVSGFLVDGTPFNFGGKNRKDVAGYDLKQLFVGSEGTLGIVTQITLKLLPQPQCRQYVHAGFETHELALQALLEVMRSGLDPSMAEFLDGRCLAASSAYLGEAFPLSISTAHLLIELDDFMPANLSDRKDKLSELLGAYSDTVRTFEVSDVSDTLWQFRRATSVALKSQYPDKKSHDVTVPIAEVPTLMAYLSDLSLKYGLTVLGYGHLGDGNIHVNFLNPQDAAIDFVHCEKQLFEYVCALGGTITGEHGIGLTKLDYLDLQFTSVERSLFQSVKAVFDPHNRLNPGKAI